MANLELWAWVGEDELGSGEVGIKRVLTPQGLTALCHHKQEKLTRPEIVQAMQEQARMYGNRISFVRLQAVAVVHIIRPTSSNG